MTTIVHSAYYNIYIIFDSDDNTFMMIVIRI